MDSNSKAIKIKFDNFRDAHKDQVEKCVRDIGSLCFAMMDEWFEDDEMRDFINFNVVEDGFLLAKFSDAFTKNR